MTIRTGDTDESREIEISLDDGAQLELRNVEIDADERPLSFEVCGIIRTDEGILDELRGKSLEPIAIRFKVRDPRDGESSP